MNVKRVRFKDPVTKENHRLRHGFDTCSVSCEVTEAPQSSNDPKTSEYAFFKKLKQDVSSTFCHNPMDRRSTHLRKLRTGTNFGELGNEKHKEVKSSIYVEKSAAGDADSFMSLKDTAQKRSGVTSKTHDDHVRFKSSLVWRTPTTIELDSFLSTAGYSFTETESQLKDGDIISSKRLKLRQWIAKTLFPETEEIPNECDVVSLLLCRLLPEESENIQCETSNMKLVETKDKSQMHVFPDSCIKLVANWDTSVEAVKSCFLGSGGSAAWSQESKGVLPSSQSFEGIDSCAVRCANGMLLGYRKVNERENSPTDIGSACWSNRLGDGNLLNWSDENYDHSTDCWPNRSVDKNILVSSNGGYNFSTPCNTSSGIPKHQMHHRFSYDGVTVGSYRTFAAKVANRTGLEHENERFDCNWDKGAALSTDQWCDSSFHVSYEKSGSRESSNLWGELNDFEIRREPSPLLLGWGTDQTNMSELSQTSDMELDTYPLLSSTRSENHLHSSDDITAPKPRAASYSSRDQCIQSWDLEDQIHIVARSRCSSWTSSYDLKQLEQNDGSFFKNIFRDRTCLFLPQVHQLSAEKTEALLLCEGAYSDSGLKCQPLTHISEKQYDVFTGNVVQLLRQDNQSSQFLLENESNPVMSRPENSSLMSVHNPVGQEVSFPLQLHKQRWIDGVETYYPDCGTPSSDDFIW